MITYRQPFKGDYPITQRYGELIPDVTYKDRPHTGIDYACPVGTGILASADGNVKYSGYEKTGYGNWIVIEHEKGKCTLYAHLSERNVFENQKVRQGDVIGLSGSTGNSTGPHLHFEARRVWCDWRSHFDPMELPLQNFADPQPVGKSDKLKEPEQLKENVVIACPDGARVFNPDWSMRYVGFPQGTRLHFTGKTAKRPGFPDLTYCEVYEEPRKFYVAVHNNDTQILDNQPMTND